MARKPATLEEFMGDCRGFDAAVRGAAHPHAQRIAGRVFRYGVLHLGSLDAAVALVALVTMYWFTRHPELARKALGVDDPAAEVVELRARVADLEGQLARAREVLS